MVSKSVPLTAHIGVISDMIVHAEVASKDVFGAACESTCSKRQKHHKEQSSNNSYLEQVRPLQPPR